MSDSRYWVLDYDPADHEADLLASIREGRFSLIVDEEAGGIVAYVLEAPGTHRGDEIASGLRLLAEEV